jgi:hypothetical protein
MRHLIDIKFSVQDKHLEKASTFIFLFLINYIKIA